MYTNAHSQHILTDRQSSHLFIFFEVRNVSCTYMMYIGGADIVANIPM